MKFPLLLTTLLLAASPVVADDFLYVVCEMEGTDKTISLPSGQVISDELIGVTSLRFKINLTEQKARSHKDPVLADISVWGDLIVQYTQIDEGGIIGQIQAIMPLNPPGPTSINNWFKTKTEYQVIQGEGECRVIDSSVFEESLKQ